MKPRHMADKAHQDTSPHQRRVHPRAISRRSRAFICDRCVPASLLAHHRRAVSSSVGRSTLVRHRPPSAHTAAIAYTAAAIASAAATSTAYHVEVCARCESCNDASALDSRSSRSSRSSLLLAGAASLAGGGARSSAKQTMRRANCADRGAGWATHEWISWAARCGPCHRAPASSRQRPAPAAPACAPSQTLHFSARIARGRL